MRFGCIVEEADSPRGRKRGSEYMDDYEPAKRAAKGPQKTANVGFHLRFDDPPRREGAPEQGGEKNVVGGRRQLNAEELGVAEGLLGLQEVTHPRFNYHPSFQHHT